MRHRTAYDEPFAWWGPVLSPPALRTLLDVIRDGVLPIETAALLWALLARRASIAVVAGPRGAGKTTLLTALLACYPPQTRRLYLRGCYESFAFADDPTLDPRRTVLLVNEISAHLPSYLWGPGVRRLLSTADRGFAIAATAHAENATAFVAGLAGYPLRLPVAEIAAFDLVVTLDVRDVDGVPRRAVREVTSLVTSDDGGGVMLETLLRIPAGGDDGGGEAAAVARAVARLEARASSVGPERLPAVGTIARVRQECDARAATLAALLEAPPPSDLSARLGASDRWWPRPT